MLKWWRGWLLQVKARRLAEAIEYVERTLKQEQHHLQLLLADAHRVREALWWLEYGRVGDGQLRPTQAQRGQVPPKAPPPRGRLKTLAALRAVDSGRGAERGR